MAEELVTDKKLSKEQRYDLLYPQLRSLVEGEPDQLANYANFCAAIKESFDFLWIGFYRVIGDELVLGNFQGPIACTRIKKGRGVCGKASIESIHSETIFLPWSSKFVLEKKVLFDLPEKLKKHQSQFEQTGGIHACALVDAKGDIVQVKEDVGRHNAMDKLIGGWESYPISAYLVLVSGRASFELVQKASKAGIPLLAAIGAPSSLAVQLAEEQGMGLIGFLRSGSFNVYTGDERVV